MSGYAEYREVNLPWLKAVPAHWEIRRNKNIFTEQKEIVGERSADYTLLSLTLNGTNQHMMFFLQDLDSTLLYKFYFLKRSLSY